MTLREIDPRTPDLDVLAIQLTGALDGPPLLYLSSDVLAVSPPRLLPIASAALGKT
jgi:hypothetical protein